MIRDGWDARWLVYGDQVLGLREYRHLRMGVRRDGRSDFDHVAFVHRLVLPQNAPTPNEDAPLGYRTRVGPRMHEDVSDLLTVARGHDVPLRSLHRDGQPISRVRRFRDRRRPVGHRPRESYAWLPPRSRRSARRTRGQPRLHERAAPRAP